MRSDTATGTMRAYQTYTKAYLQRHRDTHSRFAAFGTHQHPYLHATMRELAADIAAGGCGPPSLLDYGCGKGRFLEAMRRLGVFGELVGFDPAIPAVAMRPERRFDLVTCLDVLDQVEPRFVDAVVCDVAQFTRAVAVFDIVTKQAKGVNRKTESPFVWHDRIAKRMQVVATRLHLAAGYEYEMGAFAQRAIIIARPMEEALAP